MATHGGEAGDHQAMSDSALRLDDVDLGYGNRRVISAARLAIPRGQWTALVGPNGSGKTTLLRCAAGRLRPLRGTMLLDGKPLYPLEQWHGALPGFAVGPDELPGFLTLRQSMEIYANAHGIGAIPAASMALCRELGLIAWEHELIRNLSLGTRQKLAVVLALLAVPSLLLLDEVFNGLDIRSALVLKTHLRRQVTEHGLSIVLATHALDLPRDYCDCLVLIDAGAVVCSWEAAKLRAFGSTGELERALAEALPPVGKN
jgi:ABC-type multidrug transport system ATPase subunit